MRIENLELSPGHPKGAKTGPPALQPGAEVVDPSKGKRRFSRVRGARIRPSGAGFRRVSGPRPRAKILESENANGPLSVLKTRACPPCIKNPSVSRNIQLSGSLEGVNSEFRVATKWPYNWSAGLLLGATGTAGRAPSF